MVHAVDAGTIDDMATLMRVVGAVPRRAPRCDHRRVLRAAGQGAGADRSRRARAGRDHRALDLAQGPRAAVPAPPTLRRGAARRQDHRPEEPRVSGKVYVPGRGYDNLERVPLTEADEVVVADRGTVVVVHGHHAGAVLRPEGDRALHPVLDPARQQRSTDHRCRRPRHPARGLPRRACASAPSGRSRTIGRSPGSTTAAAPGMSVIERWEPTGEPDVDFETFKEHTW